MYFSKWGKPELLDREEWAGETERGLFAGVLGTKGGLPKRLSSGDQGVPA